VSDFVRILVTGSNGQLGTELTRQGQTFPADIFPFDLPELDITDQSGVEKIVFETRPDLIINAAAYTHVDLAEDQPGTAFQVNRDGPECLACICHDAGIPMIHISTDYVFAGDASAPYREQDPIAPLGIYGRSKAEGELRVQARLTSHIIVRTSWLYGVYGHNFVKTMLRLGRERRIIRVVGDQFGCPTSAADLAEALLRIAGQVKAGESDKWGIYHFCNAGVISWFQFAEEIFHLAGKYGMSPVPTVESITTDQYPVKAKRPSFSALRCDRIKSVFGVDQKTWSDSLELVIARILAGKTAQHPSR